MGTGVLSPTGERPGRELNHSLPPGAVVKKAWSYTSVPPICLHGTDKNYFIFIVINHNERDTVIYCLYPFLFEEFLTRF